MAASLGLFAGAPAALAQIDTSDYAWLAAPRLSRRAPPWRPITTASGCHVLFHGWIDNDAALAAELNTSGDPAAIYGAAVDRWGDAADLRIVGQYCAIVAGPARAGVRLSRSPWAAPPLHFHVAADRLVAASVPRALFAAGVAAELNYRRIEDDLILHDTSDEPWFVGIDRVAIGTIVHVEPSRPARVVRYYDPQPARLVRFAKPQDYAEAANALLAESVASALRTSERPGLSLSGGLDSPIVAAELLAQLPPGRRVPSFTFVPIAEWDGRVVPDGFGDDRPFVEAFAARYPALEPHFVDNRESGFDHRWRELFTAIGFAPNFLSNFYVYHGVFAVAARSGCDLLINAQAGNLSYSNDGRWGYVEYLLKGRWRQLYRAMKHRPGDRRSVPHKLASLTVLPMLPARLRTAVLRRRHQGWAPAIRLAGMLEPGRAAAAAARLSASSGVMDDRYPRSRREAVARDWARADVGGADVMQGFEQVYGIRSRDVAAYRPLIEFCLALPTEQLLNDGVPRALARTMAAGRLPEAQRRNTLYGQHNCDWHARLTPRRGELLDELDRFQRQAPFENLIDFERVRNALTDWPTQTALEPSVWAPRAAGVPRAIMTARFINFISGRNDL